MRAAVISVTNQKGGVGKTTTAINLASYLSENGSKTLIVDMDPQANATSGVGINKDRVRETVYDLLLGNLSGDLEKVLYPTPFENLHIVPSSKELAGAEIELVSIVSRETLLKNSLTKLRKYYEYIIIDCPPSLGLLTVNSLVASDKVIIPVQCEYFALEGIAGLINTLTLVKDSCNPDLEICGIVLTMFDKRTALNKQVVENARLYFNDLIFETVVPRNIRLTEAPSHGLPIALYSPDSRGAMAYKNLAKEVSERV
ncbi:MAG: ParA family protein [bacterium]|nr:ParA family protein [bacterium]